MKLKTDRNVTSAAFEYFLYAILVLQTAIAVFAFKTISQIAQLSLASTGYLALLYSGVLGWVFFQLNRLHRKRKVAVADPKPAFASLEPEKPAVVNQMPALQAVTPTAPVEVEAKPIDPDFDPPAVPAQTGLLLGLTGSQLAITFVVFVAALKIFTWGLATLVKP